MTIPGAISQADLMGNLVKMHACFDPETENNQVCIHLPVSPSCNLYCKFCRRSMDRNKGEALSRQFILSPQEAVSLVERALQVYPDIGMAQISGPGDCLASAHALDTFNLIHNKFPQMINCLSSNGLLLEENAAKILSSGVKRVSVMINAIDINVLKEICPHIVYRDQQMTGAAAARWLLLSQMKGIDKLSSLGIKVRIDTILMPGVNETQIRKIARITAGLGASMISVMPLTLQNDKRKFCGPDYADLLAAREAAGEYLPVMEYCEHCQTEACGITNSNLHLMRKANN